MAILIHMRSRLWRTQVPASYNADLAQTTNARSTYYFTCSQTVNSG